MHPTKALTSADLYLLIFLANSLNSDICSFPSKIKKLLKNEFPSSANVGHCDEIIIAQYNLNDLRCMQLRPENV